MGEGLLEGRERGGEMGDGQLGGGELLGEGVVGGL